MSIAGNTEPEALFRAEAALEQLLREPFGYADLQESAYRTLVEVTVDLSNAEFDISREMVGNRQDPQIQSLTQRLQEAKGKLRKVQSLFE